MIPYRQSFTILMSDTSAVDQEQKVNLSGNLALITSISAVLNAESNFIAKVLLERNNHSSLIGSIECTQGNTGKAFMCNIPVDANDRLRVQVLAGVTGKLLTVDLVGYEVDKE